MLKIQEATINDLEQLVPLFDQYRIFYEQPSDLKGAYSFLKQRISNQESIIYIALLNNQAVGFTQLYTSFSSVSLKPVFILNDLYVSTNNRGQRIGEALLNKAKEICRKNNYKGLALETAINNPAQKLYEKLGWQKDTSSFHYFWISK